MPKSLMSLAFAAQDEISRIKQLQQLLHVCLEQFDNPTEDTQDRVDLMISMYIPQMEMHINHLESYIGRIKEHLVDEVDEQV